MADVFYLAIGRDYEQVRRCNYHSKYLKLSAWLGLNMKKAFLWFFLLLWVPAIGWASEAYDYASASIEALNVVKEATSTPVKNSSQSGVEKMKAVMRSSVAQTRAFVLARSKIKQFSGSKDEIVRNSTKILDGLFEMFQTTSEQNTDGCEKVLNNPREALENQGSGMRRIFELQEQSKSNWALYTKNGGPAIAFALIDIKRISKEGTLHHLQITNAEREKLKRQLVQAFGLSIKGGFDKTFIANRVPAAVLWDFFNSEKWESADSEQ